MRTLNGRKFEYPDGCELVIVAKNGNDSEER